MSGSRGPQSPCSCARFLRRAHAGTLPPRAGDTAEPNVIVIADISQVTSAKVLTGLASEEETTDVTAQGFPERDSEVTEASSLYRWEVGYGRCIHLEPGAIPPAPRT